MQPTEWAQIIARINVNWPGQQVAKPTADEWFGPLAAFPAVEVWDAVDRCRRTLTPGPDGRPRGAWRPNLAELLEAVDANWRERAAARRELEATQARAARNARGGVPAPPETHEAIEILKRSKLPSDHPDRLAGSLARQRIEALADQLAERLAAERIGALT